MTTTLPDDLYREIVQHVSSRNDLYILSHTSRAFQKEAEHFLYRRIESSKWNRTEDLCQLLISCPRLHSLVRSLSITNEGLDTPPSTESWTYVSEVLMRLQNLESLKICNGLSMANSHAWVLDDCTALLRSVEVDFELDSHFLTFLHNQPQLRQVRWTNSSREELSPAILQSLSPHPPQFLPSVTELMTNCSPFALHLLNNCHVTHLWIHGHVAPDDEGEVQFALQVQRNALSLRSLRMSFPMRRRMFLPMLTELAQRAPKLRSIGFLPYFDANDKDVISVLASFKELRSVVTMSVISSDTSRLLAKSVPSLRLVACLHYSYSHEYVFLPVNPLGTPRPVHDPDFLLWKDA